MGTAPTDKELSRRVIRLETRLQESETRYRTLMENIQDGIYTLDTEGRFTYVNDVIVKRSGQPAEWFLDRGYLDVIRVEDRARVQAYFETVMQGDMVPVYELAYFTASGEEQWVEVNTAPLFDKGRVVGLFGVSRDINRRKRVKDALRESDERYRLLVETMSDGLGVQDENGRITYVNDKFCKMLEYESNEFIGRPVADFLDHTNKQTLKDQVEKRKAGLTEPYELHWTRKDGTLFPTIMSPQIIYDTNGKFMGSFAVITDISNQKKIEASLQGTLDETERRVRERTKELQIKTDMLEDINTALNILLKKRDEEKTDVEEQILANVKKLVLPYIAKIKKSELDARLQALIGIVESNLNEIISPLTLRLSSDYFGLTPAEIKVANLVRQGKKTKEIAAILDLSHKTIECHRENIRKKMGLKNKKVNLQTYLLSLQ
ncbi:PAS domain S-box protein [Thermodesulfobacteriota bacterium]